MQDLRTYRSPQNHSKMYDRDWSYIVNRNAGIGKEENELLTYLQWMTLDDHCYEIYLNVTIT